MAIQRITINSDLTQFADRFDLPRVGADFFLVADRHKPVEITSGYNGGSLQQLRGETDEYELTWDYLSVRGLLTGRDLGARLIDRPFRKTYFRFPQNPPPPFAFEVGAFTAAQIAAQIASQLTLTLIWNAPNYGIQDKALAFSSTGADAIHRLVVTMGQPEMFAIDVYLQDQTVIVKQRKPVSSSADYVLSHEELMAATITYRKRPGPIYGIVTIFGGSPGGPIIEIDGDDIAEEVEVVDIDETPAAPPMKAKARTTTTKRLLQSVPNEVLLRETSVTEVEIAGFLKVAETKKILTYDDSLLLDPQGRINIPLKLKEINEVYGLQASQHDLILIRREAVTYGYNDDLELILQDTLIEALENQVEVTDPHGVKRTSGGSLVPFERRIVRNQRLDANQYQVTTQVFAIETVTEGLVTVIKDGFMKLVETDTKVTRGQLPGPQRIRRPHKKQIGAGGSSTNRVIKQVTISGDPDAVHVDITDQNLTEALATQLISQFSAASGLWRHEVAIRGLALPFLTKGKVLGWSEALPGLAAPLPNALIVGRTLSYVEDGQSSLYGQTLTLVWWGAAN